MKPIQIRFSGVLVLIFLLIQWNFSSASILTLQDNISHKVRKQNSTMLYLSLVEPYLNYCNLVWASASNTVLLNKIMIIQKRFCRLMTFSNYLAHSKPLFIQLFILPIYELYKYNLAIYMFRIINHLIPPLNHHQFVLNSSIHHHYTRRRNDIHTRYCRGVYTGGNGSSCFQPELGGE